MNKAIIVVGMHRSGTSAISGVLSEMGVFMGKKLFSAQKGVNDKGFWENAKVVDLNEKIFDKLLWSWDDPLSGICSDNNFDKVKHLKVEAEKLLNKEYSNKPYWGIKDPRVSILLPFWQSLLAQKNIDSTYVLMLRHPLEVSNSLIKRDGFSRDKSLILWLNYTLSTYTNILDKKYIIISYDKLMDNTHEALTDLCNIYDESLIPKIDHACSFISKKLRHHKSISTEGNNTDEKLMLMSLNLYEALSEKEVNQKIVNEILKEFLNYMYQFNGLFKEHLYKVKKSEVYYRNLFYDAYLSYWWKIAWPIKKIEQVLRKNIINAEKIGGR